MMSFPFLCSWNNAEHSTSLLLRIACITLLNMPEAAAIMQSVATFSASNLIANALTDRLLLSFLQYILRNRYCR